MKKYQVMNWQYQPVPASPFDTERDAAAYVMALQETYSSVFYVAELNIVRTIDPPRNDK